ncbi:MAG: ATP-binding protein [Alphaproteobacteria bacterium]|nr:ATP-binding protein [Alphaproteobacteria bacterium]
MQRFYSDIIKDHFKNFKQMAFVSGPCQVGKTTIAKSLMDAGSKAFYNNWDIPKDRQKIVSQDFERLLEGMPLSPSTHPLIVLDEIHKYVEWKNYLKGLYDAHQGSIDILVTGSARLNIFRKDGDSLMGRYFLYRVHPITAGERAGRAFTLLTHPTLIPQDRITTLLEFGGFPEPFLKGNTLFSNRWHTLRQQQLIYEDVRSLEAIHNLSQLDLLATILSHQAGQLVNYTNLAYKVRVSIPTIQRWMAILDQVYYCYLVHPWSSNVMRSLLKEPKVYLWDWSTIADIGQKHENFIASHLLKAVHFWNDIGLGTFDLRFIRTKDQEEVDFVVIKDEKPWMLVEVKSSSKASLSKSLQRYKETLNCPLAFQVVFDLEANQKGSDWLTENAIEKGTHEKAVILPVASFLSILL